jgi:hypothetical protein
LKGGSRIEKIDNNKVKFEIMRNIIKSYSLFLDKSEIREQSYDGIFSAKIKAP